MHLQSVKISKKRDVGVFLLASFFITQFLFFIDEGFYDFRWMSSFGNWIVFSIYFLLIFGFQMLVFKLAAWKRKILSGIILGTIAALLALFQIFS